MKRIQVRFCSAVRTEVDVTTLSTFFFCQGYTRTYVTYNLPWNVCDIHIQNSMVKHNWKTVLFSDSLKPTHLLQCWVEPTKEIVVWTVLKACSLTVLCAIQDAVKWIQEQRAMSRWWWWHLTPGFEVSSLPAWDKAEQYVPSPGKWLLF